MSDSALVSQGLIIGLGAAALVLIAIFAWLWWKRRRRSSIHDTLRAIAVERLENILLPDGMGGEIHIEHLLLTARGILVLNVKRYEGVVFASDRMDQWTAIGPKGRSAFPNPLSALYDRVAAVRQLVRDVQVEGFVVFPSLADFSKGRPDDVRLPQDLLEAYAKPDKGDIGRLTEAFAPHWDRIRESAQPASH